MLCCSARQMKILLRNSDILNEKFRKMDEEAESFQGCWPTAAHSMCGIACMHRLYRFLPFDCLRWTQAAGECCQC
eukprot:51508-Amphidinium_carterae.1